ncbi:MAG: type II toxin-antitoxin system VapC family toxin [Chloroflexota bacterium]
MQTSADRIYLDSSAIVKIVIRESETGALVEYLTRRPRVVSCALVRVEVVRAVRPHGPAVVDAARATLSGIYQMRINETLLDMAADIGPPVLRTLDAIHVAAAWRFQPNVAVATYNQRLRDAAHAMGLPVVSPGC